MKSTKKTTTYVRARVTSEQLDKIKDISKLEGKSVASLIRCYFLDYNSFYVHERLKEITEDIKKIERRLGKNGR